MIETKDLTKTFDNFTAVDSLNLKIEKGEFFGLLGPNGAGKTTTISLLSTLLLPTKGEILIDGQQLTRQRPDLKRKISVITQEYSMRQDMNMDEIMEYQGRLYFMPRKQIKERTEELLEFCDLLKFRKRTVRKLSGGMKRKLMVCRALLTDPEILLLDEPTAGMDALSRRQMWNLLRKLNEKNLTILLTTHYMEEVEILCDNIIILDKGRIIASGTNDELKNLIDVEEKITIEVNDVSEDLINSINEIKEVIDVKKVNNNIIINYKKGKSNLENLIMFLKKNKIKYNKIFSERPTLNDVFLSLTGKELRD